MPRALIAFGLFLGFGGSLVCAPVTFLGSYPFSRLVSRLVDRPAPTLLRRTGLVLPEAALVSRFDVTESLLDDALTLTFDASEDEARAFMRQEPLADAAWERVDAPILREVWTPGTPKPPYRTTQFRPTPRTHLQVDVEERNDDLWTVWVRWGDD